MQKLTRDEMAQRVARYPGRRLRQPGHRFTYPHRQLSAATKRCSCTAKTACWGWGKPQPGEEDPELINAGKST
jgi:3-oxoadipate CoA-transferase beta subunit